MNRKKETGTAGAAAGTAVFTKHRLLESEKYREKRDLVETLLGDGETYSLQKTDEIIESFMKGRVV